MKTFQNIDKKNTFSFALKSDRKENLGDSDFYNSSMQSCDSDTIFVF